MEKTESPAEPKRTKISRVTDRRFPEKFSEKQSTAELARSADSAVFFCKYQKPTGCNSNICSSIARKALISLKNNLKKELWHDILFAPYFRGEQSLNGRMFVFSEMFLPLAVMAASGAGAWLCGKRKKLAAGIGATGLILGVLSWGLLLILNLEKLFQLPLMHNVLFLHLLSLQYMLQQRESKHLNLLLL